MIILGLVIFGVRFVTQSQNMTTVDAQKIEELSKEYMMGSRKVPYLSKEEIKGRYEIALQLFQSIQNGITTENEVRVWFGKPLWEVDISNYAYPKSSILWAQYFDQPGYASPTKDQKILGYKFCYLDAYLKDPKSGEKISLPMHPDEVWYCYPFLITVNQVTGIVENFRSFEDYEPEAYY